MKVLQVVSHTGLLYLFLCGHTALGFKTLQATKTQLNSHAISNPFNDLEVDSIPISNDVSELPSSFSDAVERAGRRTVQCISMQSNFCRIDFDTTIGDQTFTTLKSTLPMMKELACILSNELSLKPSFQRTTVNKDENNNTEEILTDDSQAIKEEKSAIPSTSELAETGGSRRTLRIFFPDMGAAVLTRRDWKMGSADLAEVPPCVETANIQNDPILPSDNVVVILCPQPSEVDYVSRVMDLSAERNIPCIIINPSLINMDQGFGVRARNIRNNMLNKFTTTYKLKTMPTGAVVREWPAGYSVWNEEATSAEGYRLLQTYVSDPTREILDTLYDAANPPKEKKPEPSPLGTAVKGIVGYFQGLSKM